MSAAAEAAAATAARHNTRRSLLLSSASAALAASAALLLSPLQAVADEGAAAAAASASSAPPSSSSLFVPDLRELPLPEAYVETSRALIKSLQDAIEADLSDADESKVRIECSQVYFFSVSLSLVSLPLFSPPRPHSPAPLSFSLSLAYSRSTRNNNKVRRKAEPAKANVREWTSRWGDGRAPAVGGSASHSALTSALRELGGFYSKRGQRARLDRETAGRLLGELAEAERGLPAEREKKRGLFSLP